MISPRSQGLFSKVISLSGTAANYWAARTNNHTQISQEMGNIFNCETENSQKLIDCLRKVDPVELTQAQWKTHLFFHKTPAKLPLSTFVPRHRNQVNLSKYEISGAYQKTEPASESLYSYNQDSNPEAEPASECLYSYNQDSNPKG